MPVSGTTTFSVTRDDIIQAALRGLSVLEEGSTPTTAATTNAAQALNLIIKNWQKDGIKLWTVTEYSVPYTTNKTSYIIGPAGTGGDIVNNKPLRLIQAFIRNTSVTPNIDTPMQILSKEEYNVLGSKFSTGTTNSVFLDVGTTTSTLYVYLTPDSSTTANYTLHLVAQRPIFDMVTSSDTFDFPSEWYLPLKWALMAELSSEYDKTLQERAYLDQKAAIYKNDVVDWDVENAGVLFQLDTRYMHYNRYG